ncbi:isochorismatase family protein [Micromonospora saelicesensis]|uniref:Nicotinamidase-related amidase n=1 Tax=Micromonospora saelicesensis TaxID=285676 RepID=A0A1C4ZFN5_9ACTN|nr:isochorismatase family protein [Micromonospora saelicesensis]RAO52161.1 Peroxyureidoacrylate/ureidoacrylate amidohydrola se [Micromonospora saelicesensis]RAO60051.1 Peroxyureidoacrylate/ureidoacrylate amidohydrola se [Micromonospora saelicesensis]SCF31745.1 Nicotinamidase-related amidase [Micromonospora saelicesensis]
MSRAALVVIDVQESFRQRPIWAYGSNPDMLRQVDRLVAAARQRGDLVVWVLHSEPGTGGLFDPALSYVRLIDGLVPAEGEPTLVKTAHNAFTTTNLQQLLTQAGITDITVCGIRTEQCVETTTRVGADLGYRMTFVTDATLTFPIPHRDLPETATVAEILADPRTLTNEEIVTRTEYALAGRFATIRTVDEVTGATLAGSRG